MANPQIENGYLKLANELWDETMKRKFTDRQQKIIKLIIRCSYGCQKKEAIIPKLKDFELCGVQNTKIKDELLHLVECKVIFWNQHTNTFSINKNHDEWKKDLVRGWNTERFRELIRINLAKSDSSNQFPIEEESSQKGNKVPEEKSGTIFPIEEQEEVSNPCGSKDEPLSKDNIKNNSKDNIKQSSSKVVGGKEIVFFLSPVDTYQEYFVYEPNSTQINLLNSFLDDGIGMDAIAWAMYECRLNGKGWEYCRGILNRFIESGVRTAEQAEQKKTEHEAAKKSNVTPFRKKREERRDEIPSHIREQLERQKQAVNGQVQQTESKLSPEEHEAKKRRVQELLAAMGEKKA
jgi:phage replication O-like protein O